MKRKFVILSLSLCLIVANAITALAGGQLETLDLTLGTPSPRAGEIIARVIGTKWDSRSIPVKYTLNNALDPIPNPLGSPVLSLADAQTTFQAAFKSWNDIPTSFIEMNVTGTSNPGSLGFDFVNELIFIPFNFGGLAVSPSISLLSDQTFANGDDIDEDGDSDVSDAIKVATDVDKDGDIEFPAGFYKAGTILDNDVIFNAALVRFTIGDAALDTNPFSVDLFAVAIHEFGHSHGLSHSVENQLSDQDGTGATMFPFIDTGDPADEFAQRSLAIDDIAWSSYIYPEGSASSGPGALGPGDVPFKSIFGLITGELRDGVSNLPIAGGSLSARIAGTNAVVASGQSGTTQVSYDPTTNSTNVIDVNNPASSILDGKYVIPVPVGLYSVGAQAIDGGPVSAFSINFTTIIGAIFGQQNFIEEFYNGSREAARELRLGERQLILVTPGRSSSGIDIVTSNSVNINNFGASAGFTGNQRGSLLAMQVPVSQVTSVNPGGDVLIQGVSFETAVVDSSVVPVFANAYLATGVVNPDNTATIDLTNPLAQQRRFIGQDLDFAPFYFNNPQALGRRVLKGISDGSIKNLFIVLQFPTTPFPGVSGQPPLVGVSLGGPVPRLAFASTNGGTSFSRIDAFNLRFSLVLSTPPPPTN